MEEVEITRLLRRWQEGDREAGDRAWEAVYQELEILARRALRHRGGRCSTSYTCASAPRHRRAGLEGGAQVALRGDLRTGRWRLGCLRFAWGRFDETAPHE